MGNREGFTVGFGDYSWLRGLHSWLRGAARWRGRCNCAAGPVDVVLSLLVKNQKKYPTAVTNEVRIRVISPKWASWFLKGMREEFKAKYGMYLLTCNYNIV